MQQREFKGSAQIDKRKAYSQLLQWQANLAIKEKNKKLTALERIALYEDAIDDIQRIVVKTVSDSNNKFRALISIAKKLIEIITNDERIAVAPYLSKLHFAHNVVVKAALMLTNSCISRKERRQFVDDTHAAGSFAKALVVSKEAKQADFDLLIQSFTACINFANLLYPLDLDPVVLQKLQDAYAELSKYSPVLRDHYADDAMRTQARLESKIEEEKFILDMSQRTKFHSQDQDDSEAAWQIRCETFSALTFPCGLDVINMNTLVYQRVEFLLNSKTGIEQLLAFLKLVLPYQSKFQLFSAKYNLNFLKEIIEANEDGKMRLFDSLFAETESYASQPMQDQHYFTGMLSMLLISVRFLTSTSVESINAKLSERYQKIAKSYYLYFRYAKIENLSVHVKWFYNITALLIPIMNTTNLAEDNNLFLRALLCLVKLGGEKVWSDKSLHDDLMLHLRSLKINNPTVMQVLSYIIMLISDSDTCDDIHDLTDHYGYYNVISDLLWDNEEIREEYHAYVISLQRNAIKASPVATLQEAHERLFSASQACEKNKQEVLTYRRTCEFVIRSFESDDVQSMPTILFEAYFRLGVLNNSHEQLLKALKYKIENPSRDLQFMIAECHAHLSLYFKEIDEQQALRYSEDACRLYNAIGDVGQKSKILRKCKALLVKAKDKEKQIGSASQVSADADISSAERQFLNAMAELEDQLQTTIRQIKSLEKEKQAIFFARYRQLSSQLAAFKGLKSADREASKVHEAMADCAALNEELTTEQSTQNAKTSSKESKWKPREEKDKEVKEAKNRNEHKRVLKARGAKSQRDIAARLGVNTAVPAAQTAPATHERKSETKHAEIKHDFLDYTVNRLSNLVAIYNKIQAIRALRAKGATSAANDFDEQNLRLALIYNLLRICVYYKLHFQESRLQNEVQLLQKLEDLRSMLIHQGAIELLDIDIVNLIPEFLQDFAREFKSERKFDKVHEIVGKVIAVDEKQIPLQKLLQALHTNDKFTTSLNMQAQLTNVVAYVLPIIQKISQPFIEFATEKGLDASLGQIKAKFTSHMQALKLLFAIFGEYYDASAFERAKTVAKRPELSELEGLIKDCRKIFRNTVAHAMDDGDAKAIYDMALRFKLLKPELLKSVVYLCFKMPEVKSTAGMRCC